MSSQNGNQDQARVDLVNSVLVGGGDSYVAEQHRSAIPISRVGRRYFPTRIVDTGVLGNARLWSSVGKSVVSRHWNPLAGRPIQARPCSVYVDAIWRVSTVMLTNFPLAEPASPSLGQQTQAPIINLPYPQQDTPPGNPLLLAAFVVGERPMVPAGSGVAAAVDHS